MPAAPSTEPPRPNSAEAIDAELYKSLRGEAQLYLEKVPTLWLQKFATMGAIVALGITQGLWTPTDTKVLSVSQDLIGGLMGAVVLTAMMIDAKIAECGLHALIVSRFLRREFSVSTKLVAWEKELWSTQGLTRIRSVLTFLTMGLPTVLVWLVAFLVLSSIHEKSMWLSLVQGFLVIALLAYAGVALWLLPGVWKKFTEE